MYLRSWPMPSYLPATSASRREPPLKRVNRAETAAELEALRRSVVRGQPYGSEAWQQQTAKQMGLQYTFRPQGRPRKRPSD